VQQSRLSTPEAVRTSSRSSGGPSLGRAAADRAKPAAVKRMRIASTKTQFDPEEFIGKLVPSCPAQLDITSKSRSIAIGQSVPEDFYTFGNILPAFCFAASMISSFLSSTSCLHASKKFNFRSVSGFCRPQRSRPSRSYMFLCIQIMFSNA
jgi:hypothetical protein